MHDPPVTWLRPRARPGYTDTAALNDIHVLLTTTTTTDGDRELIGDVAAILARTGRAMVRSRDIDITLTETTFGWPVARAESGGTTVVIRQEPASPGLLIEITTATRAERDSLTVTLDGTAVHPAAPPGDCTA